MINTKGISYWICWILVILIIFLFYTNPRQQGVFFKNEIIWDIVTYYLYLPFTFIYEGKGVQPEIVREIFDKYNIPGTFYQAHQTDNGNWTSNYTMGIALLWFPFFLLGHLWAKLGGYPIDGWSFPYQFSIAHGTLVYILSGLFYLRKILINFFSDKLTTLIILLVVLGTNYLHETFNDYLQPHAMLFTGYAALVYYVIRWHKVPKIKYAAAIGFIMGIMVLARPSEIVCVFIPILWNIYDRNSFNEKMQLIINNYHQLGILILFGFLPFIPQIIYWKVITDTWIYFSYKNTEGFDFLQPHIYNVLFSFKKSWFVYTPIIIFPIIGIFLLFKFNKRIFLAIIVFFITNFYLLSSWAAWWNGGSFGMRYFVESYAVMSIPFGFFLLYINKQKKILSAVVYFAMGFFVVLNLFQTWQYVNWIIPEDRMTYAYYKKIFFKTEVSDADRELMEVKRSFEATESFDNENEYDHYIAAFMNFDDINAFLDENKKDTSRFYSTPNSYKLTLEDEWGPKFQFPYTQIVPKNKDHAWLRVSMFYFTEVNPNENEINLVITMPHNDYNLKYRAFNFSSKKYESGKWNYVEFDYMTPFPYSTKDHFDVYLWHRGKHDLWIDDMKVEVFIKKDKISA